MRRDLRVCLAVAFALGMSACAPQPPLLESAKYANLRPLTAKPEPCLFNPYGMVCTLIIPLAGSPPPEVTVSVECPNRPGGFTSPIKLTDMSSRPAGEFSVTMKPVLNGAPANPPQLTLPITSPLSPGETREVYMSEATTPPSYISLISGDVLTGTTQIIWKGSVEIRGLSLDLAMDPVPFNCKPIP